MSKAQAEAEGDRGSTGIPFESRWERRRRRALTVPLYVGLALLIFAALPLLIAASLVTDLVLRRHWLITRCVLAISLYLACELFGILASGVFWVVGRPLFGVGRDRYVDWNYRLQSLWAGALFWGACRIFSLRVTVAGDDAVAPGPILLMIRHASTIDTLLAAVFVTARHGIRLRYVMKRELLWDPCLDIVGQRLPNVFVRRGSSDRDREIDAVRDLVRGLTSSDGVLIYPEGTRFTARKRLQLLERLKNEGDLGRLKRAEDLRHVLPARRGGVLALLAARPDLDCVILAHVGFEAVSTLNDLWNGRLIGRRIELAFRRAAAADIPASTDERERWLDDEWVKVNDWVGEHVDTGSTAESTE